MKAGVMGLSSDGLFIPGAALTRGELAQDLSALLTLGPALRKAELVGKLAVKTGTVEITGRNGTTQLFAKDQETAVTAGMSVTTKAGGRAEISYDDGSGIRMEPETQINIVRSDGFNYVRSDGIPAVAVDKLEIKMSEGRIFGALANRNEGEEEKLVTPKEVGDAAWWLYPSSVRERIRIEEPSSVTGVWGSFWSTLVTPGNGSQTTLLVGTAEVTSGGQIVSLSPGQTTSVLAPSGSVAPPTPPAPMTPGQLPQQQQPSQQPQQPQPPVSVVDVIQRALDHAGNIGASSGGGSGSSHHRETPPPVVTEPAIIISPAVIKNAFENSDYNSGPLEVSGGTEPYTFSAAEDLPDWLDIDHESGETALSMRAPQAIIPSLSPRQTAAGIPAPRNIRFTYTP